MNKIDFKSCKTMLIKCSDAIIENEKYLCELDSYVGDGDHGLTVARGFKAGKHFLENELEGESIYSCINSFSKTIGKNMGGAIGPIFQSIFLGMSNEAKETEEIDAERFGRMLKKGLDSVMIIGGAKEGDRTLVDALAPAVRAYTDTVVLDSSMEASICAAAKAAREGCVNTKNLIAKKGRAKFLGEKSRGYQDAGATSLTLIIEAMSNYINNN